MIMLPPSNIYALHVSFFCFETLARTCTILNGRSETRHPATFPVLVKERLVFHIMYSISISNSTLWMSFIKRKSPFFKILIITGVIVSLQGCVSFCCTAK